MAEKKPIEIEDIPWESPPPGEVSWWNPSNLPGMKGELRERQDPLAPLPDALGKKRGEPVSAGLSAWQEQIDAITAGYQSVRGPDSAADVVAGLRDQSRELPDPVEPVRPPEYDWQTFQVRVAVQTGRHPHQARLDELLEKQLAGKPFARGVERNLPRRPVVLFGSTGFDDDEFPPAVHTTSELADAVGRGFTIKQVEAKNLDTIASPATVREARRAKRRKRIDVAG